LDRVVLNIPVKGILTAAKMQPGPSIPVIHPEDANVAIPEFHDSAVEYSAGTGNWIPVDNRILIPSPQHIRASVWAILPWERIGA
jgi:hypothetical protein